jgi:hypothetical protein
MLKSSWGHHGKVCGKVTRQDMGGVLHTMPLQTFQLLNFTELLVEHLLLLLFQQTLLHTQPSQSAQDLALPGSNALFLHFSCQLLLFNFHQHSVKTSKVNGLINRLTLATIPHTVPTLL